MTLQPPLGANKRVPIAVTGLGCWYPGARDPQQLWENILSRRLEFRSIPDNRLPLADYCDPAGNDIDKSYAKRVAVLDGFEFDWVGRRIPKSMFESTDIVHWLSVVVAEQALADAGYNKESLDKDATGVIVGNTLTGDSTRAECMRLRWPFVRRALHTSARAHGLPSEVVETIEHSMEKVYKSAFSTPTADTLAGGLANTIAGRVCNYFDLHGGGYIVDGACSSSLLAVCTAARALSMGDLRVALVGGVDLSIDPFELVGFSRAGALSKGDMNVYDRAAAGFIAGEGCGFVVLKRLEDARRDKDSVYAVLNGWGISSDGKGGIMTPSSRGQAMAIRRAYENLTYTPADLDFVEGHGTGTRVGDQIELQGISESQSNGNATPERRTGMTSLKSIIGHTKAAAGIGAFIKATMAVNRRVLPPTGSCVEPNPVFNETCRSLYPLAHGQVMEPNQIVRAGVSAMGFGGINSHVTLESGDAPSPKIAPGLSEAALLVANQTSEIFVLTGASIEQLAIEVNDLMEMASGLSGGDLIDLSAKLALRASDSQPIRAAVIAGNVSDLVECLESLSTILKTCPPVRGEVTSTHQDKVWLANRCDQSRIGFLFPGQSAQQVSMARKLCARYPWAQQMVDTADRIQASSGLPTMTEAVFADEQRNIERDQQIATRKKLAQTEVAQISIVVTSLIYTRYLKRMGIEPVVCGGHSLGELTALHLAGAFDFETLLNLVSLRGRAMASPERESGAMAALFCSRDQAESLIAKARGYVVLANINSPKQVVVSGDVDAISEVMQAATELDISVVRLNVSNAFHSRYVQPAAKTLHQDAVIPECPERLDIDVFSGMTGEVFSKDVNLRNYLSQQVIHKVDFVSMVQTMEKHCDLFMEVGPNRVLSRLTNEVLNWSDVDCQPTASDPNLDCDLNVTLARAFTHGVDVQWQHLFDARLARPFVPPQDRKFIGNPCENEFVDLGVVEQIAFDRHPQNIATHATEIPFTPAEQEQIDHAKSTGGNGSSLQDSVSVIREAFEDPVMRPRLESSSPRNETNSPPKMRPMIQETATSTIETNKPDDQTEDLIVEIIHERTGFPKASLTSDLRLLDDLNLDSIKAGDVIATAARKIGALGPIDPASLANATLGDVVVAVRQAKHGHPDNSDAPRSAADQATDLASDENPPVPTISVPMQAKTISIDSATPVARQNPSMTQQSTGSETMSMDMSSSASRPAENDHADDGVESTVLDIIHDRTGFPKNSLNRDLRLLDDLNMDSIKAGDVVASAARKLGALGPIDPATLANATIQDVVQAIRRAKGPNETHPKSVVEGTTIEEVVSTGVLPPPSSSMASIANNDMQTSVAVMSGPSETKANEMMSSEDEASDWVRDFEIELVLHRPEASQRDISKMHFRVLYDPQQHAFVELLHRRFHERGATASFETYEQGGPITGDPHDENLPHYVIAILPKNAEMIEDVPDRIQGMIQRLRRAVANTNPATAQPLATGVAFVQFGNGMFGSEGHNNLECCTAAAFARALHLESPWLEVRVIDFADQLSDFLATDFITNEVAAEGQFRDAAFDRLGRRYETRHKLLQSSNTTETPLNLNEGDVVLVTGGAKGITAECAYALAEKTGARLALVGSSPHHMGGANAADCEIQSTLDRFANLPNKVEYYACDLTDEQAVRRLVSEIDSNLGKVTALVHGAGRNHPAQASTPSLEQVYREISPKVLGAIHLLNVFEDRSLKYVVGLTSIIGVTGIPGNAWYAFSNETLDLLLRQFNASHPETVVRSISYSAWSGVGMGARDQIETGLRRMGIGLISPTTGANHFLAALMHDRDDPQVIVTGSLGDLDTWRPSGRDKCTSQTRFVDQVIDFSPGVSVKNRVTLSHHDDPYLADHIYEGTCLFPAVFGLEAMAQTASHLMNDWPSVIRFEKIELSQPIIIGDEGKVELQIEARVIKSCSKSGETIVRAGIRTERTQFQQEHFACEVVFGTPRQGPRDQELIADRLEIDPGRDLYDGILFQGPRFRRWGDTYHLQEGRITFDVAHCDQTCGGKDVFGPQVQSGPLFTGDPFYRDVLLQSVQAVIPQKTGLPLSIEKIELFAPANEGMQSNRRLVTSQLHVIGDTVGDEHVCEIVAKDPFGEVRERMTGYRVKVLAIQDSYPTANELADLESFDQRLFAQQTAQMFERHHAKAPYMQIRRMPELHALSKPERHEAERTLMEETVRQFQSMNGKSQDAPVIDWKATGKPFVWNDSSFHISLTHDEDYCLCIANSMVAGCDLAPITQRSHDQWSVLVGGHNEPLLDQLVQHGDCLNKAGTRIWAAVEAVQKAIDDATPVSLQIDQVNDHEITFITDQLEEGSVLVTASVALHRNPERILAIVAPSANVEQAMPSAAERSSTLLVATTPEPITTQKPVANMLVPSQRMASPNMTAALQPARPMHSQSISGHTQPNAPTRTMNGLTDAQMSAASMLESRSKLSATVAVDEMLKEQDLNLSVRADVAPPGVDRVINNVKAEIKWNGPRSQAVFEHHFVVTFKECAMRGKHVQHTQYLGWMGSIRENGLLYLVPDVVIKLSDGQSGMATNWTNIDVVGEAMMGDVVVARLFMEEMTDATINLCCDFSKKIPGGRLERLATVRQATTWVHLHGKNEPTKAAFPKFILDAFQLMKPRDQATGKLPELPEKLGRLKLEQQKLEKIDRHDPIVLWKEHFNTCLDDSNIVANIYYSRYFHWQWRTLDQFLFHQVPQLISSIVDLGSVRETLSLNDRIDYMRDGFPFDRIRTELAVLRSTDTAATLQYTHLRVNEDETCEKLCEGTQDIVWVRRTPSGTPVPEPFPMAVREALGGM